MRTEHKYIDVSLIREPGIGGKNPEYIISGRAQMKKQLIAMEHVEIFLKFNFRLLLCSSRCVFTLLSTLDFDLVMINMW